MTISYQKKTWSDTAQYGTALTASELNRIENGVSAASGRCNAIDSLLYIDKTPKTLYSERNGDGYCKYARFANIVVLNADWLSIDKMTPKRIGTLPAGYRPSYSVIGMGVF